MRTLSFATELRSLKEKKGSSRIFKKMSDVRQIGDIERVHRENRSVRERKKSIDFEKIRYGRRGSLDYDSNADFHELRSILETAIGQRHLCQFMNGGEQEKEVSWLGWWVGGDGRGERYQREQCGVK